MRVLPRPGAARAPGRSRCLPLVCSLHSKQRVKSRRSKRRADILNAAATLFAEVGFEQATVQAIVERANTTLTTFYRNYDGKADLLDELVPERLAVAADAARGAMARETGLEEKLLAAVDAGCDSLTAIRSCARCSSTACRGRRWIASSPPPKSITARLQAGIATAGSSIGEHGAAINNIAAGAGASTSGGSWPSDLRLRLPLQLC